ncbi:MAG: LysR substrate-binding domain-containing protein [Pseudomonadota bacterium]
MKRGTLPLNALRAFEATMRHGQMKLAAEELGVTYGAVSRQVRGLEETLGVSLFDGPRNKLTPSQAARDLQPVLQEAFYRIETAVLRTQRRATRTLDLSCLSTLAMRWLIPRLFDFRETHPGIDVRMTADDAPVDFSRDRFDVAIRVGLDSWDGANVTELFADEVGPVLTPTLLESSGSVTWENLSALPLLHTRTRPAAWTEWCSATGNPVPSGGQEFEHFYFMLEAATAGLGVAIAPEVLVRDDLAAGRLFAPFGFRHSAKQYVALTPDHPSAEAVTFIRWLELQAKADGSSR